MQTFHRRLPAAGAAVRQPRHDSGQQQILRQIPPESALIEVHASTGFEVAGEHAPARLARPGRRAGRCALFKIAVCIAALAAAGSLGSVAIPRDQPSFDAQFAAITDGDRIRVAAPEPLPRCADLSDEDFEPDGLSGGRAAS